MMCNFWPRQTFLPLFLGSVIEATGMSILAWALNQGHVATIYGMMALTGAGSGLRMMPMNLHGVGFFPNNIAAVMSITSFATPLGSTCAMTIMNTVFTNKVGFSGEISKSSLTQTLKSLTPEIQKVVEDHARRGVVWAFISILPFMWLCVLAATFLGNVRITRTRTVDEQGQVRYGENTTDDAFLKNLVRRRFRGLDKKEKVKESVKEDEKVNDKTPEHLQVAEANLV